jgi:hypothetical protein
MDTVDSADGAAGAPPAPLTVKGVPTDPHLRVMALATLVNTLGNGALTTTFALYFTHVVGLRATQVGLALSVAAWSACSCRCRWATSATSADRESCCGCS